jgi:HK97 family phage major capsid protein
MDPKKLREQRASLWEQMKANLAVAARTPELDAEYDRMEAECDKLDKDIERADKHVARGTAYDAVNREGVIPPVRGGDDPPARDEAYARAFAAFLVSGANELSAEDRTVLRSGFVDGSQFRNAAGVGTGAAGGYAVPPEFRDIFVETLKYYGPMIQLAERLDTASGANIPWPTNDDTGNVGAILAENTQISEQDVTLGTNSLDAYMYTSKLVRVSYQLMQDRPDFAAWLARKLGERVGRILNQHFTTGTGTAQPDGIVTSATVGVTGTGSFATTGGIAYDNLVDLLESLDPAYGAGAGLRWMMHQTGRKAIRKVKDSQGRPLWEPSLQAGVADSLLGYPISINNDMATLAVSSKSVLFGNINEAYVVRLVQELMVKRLEERYADFLQVGFFGFERADGTMQNANAVRVFQTTASA